MVIERFLLLLKKIELSLLSNYNTFSNHTVYQAYLFHVFLDKNTHAQLEGDQANICIYKVPESLISSTQPAT